MLTVACVAHGNYEGRVADYVERLHDMVWRNLEAGFAGRFVVLTDRPAAFSHIAGIECQTLPADLSGWWAKMALFEPKRFAVGERIWYFDLDTVITGPLEPLITYPGAFGLLEDVYRPGGYQSSVMSFIAGSPLIDSLWEEWHAHGCPKPAGGDQRLLETFWQEWLPKRIGGAPFGPDFLQTLYPGRLRSYKVDCVWEVPPRTALVFFHGQPRPHEVTTGWVPHVWKVGGGAALALVLIGTVAQERVLANVLDAAIRGYDEVAPSEAHDGLAIICGGGPSLTGQRFQIAALQGGGGLVFSTNQADAHLRVVGISPNFHIMLDARPQLCEWVNPGGTKLYASICDPKTLARGAAAGRLGIWHPFTQGIEEILPKDAMLIGGGNTVGLRAMALAFAMGFRRLALFGFDSCYTDGAHHAYAQPLNDGERVLDCIVAGKRFKAAPWMASQAQDFREIATLLMEKGCEIVVHGEGMIAAVAEAMGRPADTTTIEGILWPAHDVAERRISAAGLADLSTYIARCKCHRTALQAGGNVGLWPKALAKTFTTVYTFEPDALNWHCLDLNVTERNVVKRFAALSNVAGSAAIARELGACGASAIATGDEFQVITIDSLELAVLDLLCLDIEGYELFALQGAKSTIRRCSPLIVVELKGLGSRYGYEDSAVHEYLTALGYARLGVAHRDVIYERKLQ
jgi:FkbM family methyltransferase